MKRKGFIVAIMTTFLTACTATTIAPAEQVQQDLVKNPTTPEAQATHSVVKKQLISEYRCKKGKIVRVQRSTKKNSTIIVSLNQISYKLSPTVSSKGKKYSNIRWTWLEDFKGKGTLRDNRNNLLAENCVKK